MEPKEPLSLADLHAHFVKRGVRLTSPEAVAVVLSPDVRRALTEPPEDDAFFAGLRTLAALAGVLAPDSKKKGSATAPEGDA